MRRSWLVARVVPSVLVLVVVGAVLVWMPTGGSAGRARVSALDISPIHAAFDSELRKTTYSVPTVSDPSATFQWTLVITAPLGQVDPNVPLDPGCNNHGALAGLDTTFVWHHGNAGDPLFDDGCDHNLQGKWGHQGLIVVVVSDSQGDHCTATYMGTFSTEENAALGQNAASDRVCTQAPPPTAPPPPPPPPAKPCKCAKLTVSIVPASIKIEDHDVAGQEFSFVRFSLSWKLTCTAGGSGKCEGEFGLLAGEKDNVEKLTQHIVQRCRGLCGSVNLGRSREKLDFDHFFPFQRAKIGKLPIVIEPYCRVKKKPKPIKLEIVFTKAGNVDLENSKLG
jgi:hypothetical protein